MISALLVARKLIHQGDLEMSIRRFGILVRLQESPES